MGSGAAPAIPVPVSDASRRLAPRVDCALALLLTVGWQPLPDALLRQLENRTQVPVGRMQPYAGMVLFGGAIEPPHLRDGREQVSLNEAAERTTVPVASMRQFPHLVLLFTGGGSGLLVEGTSAAPAPSASSEASAWKTCG